MQHRITGVAVGLGLVFLTSLPASAQLWHFPDYAVPSAVGGPSTFLAGTYGRGLNTESGELDAFGGVVGRTGETASFMGGLGVITGGGDSEVTLGGSVAVDVVRGESVNLGLQGGIGWWSPGDVTSLRFPIGLAVKGAVESPEARITPWAMPRLDIRYASFDGDSDTSTDFGASAGVSFTFPSGFGVHTALDVLLADGGEPWLFGIGGHYLLGNGM
jgi:hypothetical protein